MDAGEVGRCAYCQVLACYRGDFERLPSFCPMRSLREVLDEARRKYFEDDEARKLAVNASIVEASGYMKWPRLREVMEYARRLNIRRIGIAFCIGLRREANYVSQALENAGFQVYSVCCKVGGICKGDVGVPKEHWLSKRPFEAICNPIGQALVLNALNTELNLVVGLCVGHDSLFYRFSRAPVVTLIAKDRVTGHNPAAAIYTGYYQRVFGIKP
ncbi:MAG: DUF1847 domain-containing protein [archaeon GB-1867-005]|nr:DUF1847 domain-containing protein [Candidatus Culexmicrobium cathedralense]